MIKVRKTLIIGITLLVTQGLFSQASLNGGGGKATGNGGSSSFSIGQTFVETQIDTSGVVSQGVQQPYEWLTLEIKDSVIAKHFDLNLYPNPTSGKINLIYNGNLPNDLIALIYDSNGKLLKEERVAEKQTSFDITTWPVGVYYLRINAGNQKIITYKIIKN
jgi:hypothetical protein